MIENKNQFKKAIKENKIKEIKRIYNFEKDNKIKENEVAEVVGSNSTSFQLKWNCLEKATYTYFDNIEVKNNRYYLYQYLSANFNTQKIEYLKQNNINILPLDEKEYKKINEGTNANYKYKFVIMINEIVEK